VYWPNSYPYCGDIYSKITLDHKTYSNLILNKEAQFYVANVAVCVHMWLEVIQGN